MALSESEKDEVLGALESAIHLLREGVDYIMAEGEMPNIFAAVIEPEGFTHFWMRKGTMRAMEWNAWLPMIGDEIVGLTLSGAQREVTDLTEDMTNTGLDIESLLPPDFKLDPTE